jgi:hypothetical protein
MSWVGEPPSRVRFLWKTSPRELVLSCEEVDGLADRCGQAGSVALSSLPG